MNKIRSIHAFIFAVAMLILPSAALACACCVDPGYYEISTARPSDYEMSYIEEIKFAGDADIYQSEAGFDGITGLGQLRKDQEADISPELSVVEEFLHRTWHVTIRSKTGHSGTLTLPMPASMLRFKVDLHDNGTSTETSLYKELRFKGPVAAGNGMFRNDVTKGTTYFLVFQGRGNGCDSSSDYTNWRLELSGNKAKYAFFGKIKN